MSEFFELKSYDQINWQELVLLLNEFSFEDQDVFEFESLSFLVMESDEGEEVECAASTAGYDFDIYFNPKINKEELKKRFFHEVVECIIHRYKTIDAESHKIAEELTARYFGE